MLKLKHVLMLVVKSHFSRIVYIVSSFHLTLSFEKCDVFRMDRTKLFRVHFVVHRRDPGDIFKLSEEKAFTRFHHLMRILVDDYLGRYLQYIVSFL